MDMRWYVSYITTWRVNRNESMGHYITVSGSEMQWYPIFRRIDPRYRLSTFSEVYYLLRWCSSHRQWRWGCWFRSLLWHHIRVVSLNPSFWSFDFFWPYVVYMARSLSGRHFHLDHVYMKMSWFNQVLFFMTSLWYDMMRSRLISSIIW